MIESVKKDLFDTLNKAGTSLPYIAVQDSIDWAEIQLWGENSEDVASIQENFDEFWMLNLHGNLRKKR